MFPFSTEKIFDTLLIIASLVVGVIGFLIFCTLLRTELSIQKPQAILGALMVLLITLVFLMIVSRGVDRNHIRGGMAIAALTAAGTFMVLGTAYQFAAYISLPVDLLSFAESPFITDILKLRLGMSIYSDPLDNNTYPYNPGTQLLTYLISVAFGKGDSIPFLRAVQFSYVILASVVATSVCDLMARSFLSKDEYRYRLLWISAWWPFLFLVGTDPQFNPYTHSLHNDGLALLIAISAFWLMARYAIAPRSWLLGIMAVLPAVGFLVKQNQMMWVGVFSIFLLVAGNVSWRQFSLFLLSSVSLIAITIGLSHLIWGDYYLFWIFRALGDKQVSLTRSVLHLFWAGIYVSMGLFGGWMLVLRKGSRTAAALWICWLIVFGLLLYTSGISWVTNHLGPGVVLGVCWFFVALVKLWPTAEKTPSWWHYRAQEAVAVSMVILLFGSLGLVREPRNPVPPDFFRYVAEIEREFQGAAPDKVLMDFGTWVYLKENVLMKDRSASVSLHVGKNQPEINHAMLAATIKRIEQKTYDKILARQLDTGHTAYDFQDRGSGVKAAILANYRVVRRIHGVEGVDHWWPEHLVSEILVLVPRQDEDALPVSPESSTAFETQR